MTIHPQDHTEGTIEKIQMRVNNGVPIVKRTLLKDSVLKDARSKVPHIKRERQCKQANVKSHSDLANMRRENSEQMGKDLGFHS